MKRAITKRTSWKEMLSEADKPVQLPVARNALTARLIERAEIHVNGGEVANG